MTAVNTPHLQLGEKALCVYQDDYCELWHADALNPEHVAQTMAERVANALVVDAPYSAKTHTGHRNGKLTADRAAAYAERGSGKRARERAYNARKAARGESGRRDLNYDAWSVIQVDQFVEVWVPRCSGWMVSLTDDVLAPHWGCAFEVEGLYRFAPLPLVETGGRVRMTGDGPSNWTCWIVVARPRTREFASWGTLPGAYVQPAEREFNTVNGSARIVGGKPLRSMCSLVSDYSRRGDLIVDPCCGGGTTLRAAKMCGRKAIGMDISLERLQIASELLRGAREQGSLFDEDCRPPVETSEFWEREHAVGRPPECEVGT